MASKFFVVPNPMLVNTLKQVYRIRYNIISNKNQFPSDDSIDTNVCMYSDGSAYALLQRFDRHYGIHHDIPRKQYDLLNTSLIDSLNITAIRETRNLINEIKNLTTLFETKSSEVKQDEHMVARSGGALIDQPVQNLYDSWINKLNRFEATLNESITRLYKVPLNSNYSSTNSNLQRLINRYREFEGPILEKINYDLNLQLVSMDNRVCSLSDVSSLVKLSGNLSALAAVLMKMANDVRFLSSGPRSGFGLMRIPENEPGSSIMPGKVNPTQCEALTMVCAQVIGNHQAVTISAGSNLFDVNYFKPLIANNVLRSTKLLEDAIRSFRLNCAVGIEFIYSEVRREYSNFSF